MGSFRTLALLAILGTTVYALPQQEAKAIGIFNVVRFPNDVCNTETAMNGTCYTAEECSDRDGIATGSCADGFGVCCVISISCGATTSENCTYLTAATGSVTPGSGCTYTICPASSTVSRIRLELTMFNIAAPFGLLTDGTVAAAAANLMGGAVGQCTMDTFQVIGSGGASPVICGSNDGQHMIVDTDGAACVTAAFSFGSDAVARNYRIHAIQYDRLNEMGGPAGCLQFFTGATGTVNTFNWATLATSTHLANQDYDVCVRRMQDRCTICWSPIATGDSATPERGSFGLSNGGSATADAAPTAGSGASCEASVVPGEEDSNDYIIIPNGQAAIAVSSLGTAAVVAGQAAGQGFDKYCGRYLNADIETEDGTVCSRVTPFKLSVFTDGGEAIDVTVGLGAAAKNEASAAGLAATEGLTTGTMGFSLGFSQLAC